MELVGAADSTMPSYWLNWWVLLCAAWVLASVVLGSYIIWKCEGSENLKSDKEEAHQEIVHSLRKYDAWRPCIKEIHPIWLLAFRIVAFCLLLVVLIADLYIHGVGLFYFYTQWTLILLTIYFGFGSLLSIYGGFNGHREGIDAGRGSYVPPLHEENMTTSRTRKNLYYREEYHSHERTGICNYIFQVMFQTSAGAVMLTDCVYWFIIFPFLTIKDYSPNFLTLTIHSVNALLLLGDAALNCLWLPWFRISYFFLWTGFFIIFQWIIHACILIRWPYPFMDLSSPYAPLWYFLVGLMHIPCYGIFTLIVRLKYHLLLRYFPQSY